MLVFPLLCKLAIFSNLFYFPLTTKPSNSRHVSWHSPTRRSVILSDIRFQGPFARFGDTAANAGLIALLSSLTWPVWIKTIAASVASACFRMILTPIDTLKTTQQTNGGKGGLRLLKERIADRGVGCLWYGALATAAATFVGHCELFPCRTSWLIEY